MSSPQSSPSPPSSPLLNQQILDTGGSKKGTGSSTKLKPKVVVLDVDETLGFFLEFGIFCDALSMYLGSANKPYEFFYELMELYPEILRPHIVKILEYVYMKKTIGECHRVMIYTNNNGPKSWVIHIKTYLEMKIAEVIQRDSSHKGDIEPVKLFDQIIAAFMINGKVVEPLRTTHEKTMDDFLRCSKLPSNIEVCFIEDTMHEKMLKDNVYYIKLKPYHYSLPNDVFVTRFIESPIFENIPHHRMLSVMINETKEETFRNFIINQMKVIASKYNYIHHKKNPAEYELDNITSKRILSHLTTFFKEVNGDYHGELIDMGSKSSSSLSSPKATGKRSSSSSSSSLSLHASSSSRRNSGNK